MTGKTIKDISIELGVSKQSVWQRIKRDPNLSAMLQDHSKMLNRTVMVDDIFENRIKQIYLTQTVDVNTDPHVDDVDVNAEPHVNDVDVNTEPHVDDVDVNTDPHVDDVDVNADPHVDDVDVNTEPHVDDVDVNADPHVDDVDVNVNFQLSLLETQISILKEQLSIVNNQLAIKDNQIRMLQEQLAAKDTQIIQITSAMESTASALNAAQALHAGTIQRQIAEQSSSRENAAPDDPEQPKQKQGFFSRLFSKKT